MLKTETKEAFIKCLIDHDFVYRNQHNKDDILVFANAIWSDWAKEDESVAKDYYFVLPIENGVLDLDVEIMAEKPIAPPEKYVRYWFNLLNVKSGLYNVERLNALLWVE